MAGGVAGACLVAAFAGELANLFEGSGQELFNAAILIVAVMMLTWHNVWMAGHGREMARDMRRMGAEVTTGQRTLTALAVVVGVAVLREGSEVVLFLYGIAAQGGLSTSSMLTGGALGLAAGAAVSALMYFGLLTIPAHRLFQVTSWLITLLAAGMASQAVLSLQNGGYLQFLMMPVWDTSWLLSEGSIAGAPAAHAGRLHRPARRTPADRLRRDHPGHQLADASGQPAEAGSRRAAERGRVAISRWPSGRPAASGPS